MNSRDIYNFIATCREGSIAKAAEKLYITPQGLSKSLRKTEKELGVQLLVRTPQGIELTGYGERFLERSKAIYQEMEDLRTMFDGDIGSAHGRIKISSALGILSNLYPDYLFDFNKVYPNVEVMIKESPDRFVDEDVQNESVSLGLTKEPVDHRIFDVYPIGKNRHCAIVYRGHPLYDRDCISIKELKGEKIIIENRDFKVYHKFVSLCEDAGFTPNIYFETTEISMAHKLAHMKKGIAVSLETEKTLVINDDLKIVYFEEDFICEWIAVTKKNREPDSITREMLKFLGLKKAYD